MRTKWYRMLIAVVVGFMVLTITLGVGVKTTCTITEVQATKPTPDTQPTSAGNKPWTDPTTGMEFEWVPGGCFAMGSPESEQDRANDEGVHEVCVGGLWVGKYEVTQGEWVKVTGSNPSYYKKMGDRYPVEMVSWADTQEYIKKLNRQSGKQYRLPTEAEWEHGCQGGASRERYCGGNDIERVAWYSKNGDNITHAVGSKAANGYGLYDMSGNVMEWCADWYDKNYYATSPRQDPAGPPSSPDSYRVVRGGHFLRKPVAVRAAHRGSISPDGRGDGLGFRLVLPPDQ